MTLPIASTKNPSPIPPSSQGPFVSMDAFIMESPAVLDSFSDEAPSVAESETSSLSEYEADDSFIPQVEPRTRLQWQFKGLTLWLEFEEFDKDLSRAIDYAVRVYGTENIPMAHATAIYGMTHLSQEEAITKLAKIPHVLPNGQWPRMERPKGVTQDIAQDGRPGQVCSISWAELTLKTNADHEKAVDQIYNLFEVPTPRKGLWKPHISLAYDNPEDSVLNLQDTISYVTNHPSLARSRRVKAISLWNTDGKLADWQCLDRVNFYEE
jgi:hypothetical protein